MKLIQIGLLPIIAILTTSLTAFNYSGIVTQKKQMLFTCDPVNPNHYWKGELKHIISGTINFYRNPEASAPGITTCPGQVDFCAKVSTLVPPSEEFLCNEQAQQFCCLEILPAAQTLPCSTISGNIDFLQHTVKARIYCRGAN